jgi:Gnt-I system low-affinity gluconate transporter
LSKRTGKHVLTFALPLLSGIAVTHSFVPPTPGPVAAADILNADLGMVILAGLMVGVPTAWFAGVILSPRLCRTFIGTLKTEPEKGPGDMISSGTVYLVLTLIAFPIILILQSTLIKTLIENQFINTSGFLEFMIFLGHPISALIICTLLALYLMGTRYGYSREEMFKVCSKSLTPAGSIILITGAGGVLKQMLIETGAGTMIAEALSGANMIFMILAYIIATLVRVIQGSATVAMITAAGIIAPLVAVQEISGFQNALIVLAIASGSVFMSHVNDSGFWLVNRYLDLSVPDTLKTVSVLTTGISVFSFVIILILSAVI